MDLLLILPLIIPLAAATLMLFAWSRPRIQLIVNLAATALSFAVALLLLASVWRNGIQATQLGGWPAPFGITLVSDLLSAIMLLMATLLGLAVAVYSVAGMDGKRKAFGYYPLYQVLMLGIAGSILTGDLFNLYVWFEVMLIASFALLSLGGTRPQMEASIKYVTLNLIASDRVRVDDLITHRLPLEETAEGFRLVAEADESIKVIIEPEPGSE